MAIRLHSIRALSDPNRLPGVDVLRGIAIIAVVFYHFGQLPFGELGVDLFFVISGFLVARPLVRDVSSGRRPRPLRFVAARAFKIWPSYYAFLALGTALAVLLYRESHPDQIITLAHAPRYLLFFQNYRGTPHWSFDHVWSLCVEEHFYVLLPIGAAVAFRLLGAGARSIVVLAALGVVLGIAAKLVGFSIGFETYSATHNRVDALSWGVLIAVAHERRWPVLRRLERSAGTAVVGALVVAGSVASKALDVSRLFSEVLFHSLVPVGAGLVLVWARTRAAGPAPIRLVGYYSYNLYLWHPLFVLAVRDRFGSGATATVVYLLVSSVFAVAATVLVEEPCMRLRRRVLSRGRGGDAEPAPDRVLSA